MEEKPISQHTICTNGHLGGCQKCHMSRIRALYRERFDIYSPEGNQEDCLAQRCMFCRNHIFDIFMGENWAMKLHKIQCIAIYQGMVEREPDYGKQMSLEQVMENHEKYSTKPKPRSYQPIRDMVEQIDKSQINDFCKYLGKMDEVESVEELEKNIVINEDSIEFHV